MIEVGTEIRHLSDLKSGESAIITQVLGRGAFRKRITEMGFIKGKKVKVIKNAPLNDPIEYEIMGYNVSLRRSEADMIQVLTGSDCVQFSDTAYNGTSEEDCPVVSSTKNDRIIRIALVGNPNCGKTTLFNYASGSHERVGNYSGVTVDAKEAVLKKDGYQFIIVDLPGTYSITEYSPEELYVRHHIIEKKPDIVVNVIDSSNLERNLYLTTQLIDMNVKVVIALNMYDELKNKGVEFDYGFLGKMIGIPVVPTVASKGQGIDELFSKLIEVYENRDPHVRHVHINYGKIIESGIMEIQTELRKAPEIMIQYSTRYLAIKLIEGDKTTLEGLGSLPNFLPLQTTVRAVVQRLEKEYAENSETIITDAKYGFIEGALKETYKEPAPAHGKVRTLDDLFTHKIWGFPIFIFFMWLMFQATFAIGQYPMNWIESGVSTLGSLISRSLNEGPLRDLLVDGIIAGVGGVIVFLPNILILFFFISLMEDSGYMARAAFIMDKLMHKIGLHGKSFIPLIMGFGCNVPAIMATRTLENRTDRLLTMIITPFMSCSARLPVYVLLISAFFPNHRGLVLFSLYLTGILLAVAVALVMKKIAFSKKEVPFVMELPPYRIPTLKNTGLHMWHKAQQYLRKMGTVILVASIIIWALGYFPRDASGSRDYASREQSYIGKLGHAIEPIIRPLGFDWKMGVSILSGLAAKEIVVSTMGVLYNGGAGNDNNDGSLISNLRNQESFTPLVALCFMLFVLIYFPCIAVIAAIKKESSWKWALFTMAYTTGLAWVVTFGVYQIGSFFI
ncbi:MAG: ferrous iron transport protein B [Bacteroidales bacterium]